MSTNFWRFVIRAPLLVVVTVTNRNDLYQDKFFRLTQKHKRVEVEINICLQNV